MAIYQGIDSGKTKVRKITIKGGWQGVPSVSKNKPGKKILVLPSNLVTFRQFSFPFQDKKRIKDVLPGELMETAVLPLEKLVWDTPSIYKENANVLIAVREELDKYLKEYGNSAQIIDAEPCAFSRVAAYNKIKDALIIDFGATKTTFCGIKDGRINMLRVRMMGGKRIDQMIAEQKKISIEEAEEIKCTEGMNLKSVKLFMDALLASAALDDPLGYEKIILTGGGGQMPGLAEYLQETLKTEVSYFKLPEGISPFYDVSAFGAALYEITGQEKVNFRKESIENGKVSYYWLFFLLIPILIFSIGLIMKLSQLEKENKLLMKSMEKAVLKEYPKIGKVTSPVQQVRSFIKREKSEQAAPTRKIIPILNDIAISRRGLEISFYELDITEDEIKLKGEANSFDNVDKFRTALAKYFENAEIADQKTKPNDRVDFTIKIGMSKGKTKKTEAKLSEAQTE